LGIHARVEFAVIVIASNLSVAVFNGDSRIGHGLARNI
jgi:hypothetical protein